MPTRRSRSAVAGPTPGITVTCIGRSRSCSVPGTTTTRPSGLSRSEATLAMNFEVPRPDRGGQAAGRLVHVGPDPLGQRRHRRDLQVGQVGLLEVDERLVQGQRLHQRGDLAQQAHHDRAGVAVGVEPAGEERRVRAPGAGLARRHRRAHAVLPRLVRRRGHHAAAAGAAHHDRLAAQGRLVALLDRGEERVQVQVEDRGAGRARPHRTCRRHRPASLRRTGGSRPRFSTGVRRTAPAASVVVGSVLS